MKKIDEISTYILLRLMVTDYQEDYFEDVGKLSAPEVLKELIRRHKINHQDDKKLWVQWFCTDCCESTEEQKNSLLMTLKIKEAENKFFSKKPQREEE